MQEASQNLEISDPSLRDVLPYQQLNMSTGPVHVTDGVLRAPLDGHVSSHSSMFWSLHAETTSLLSDVFETSSPVLAMHGSIRNGLDVSLRSLLPRVRKTLILCNGFWGDYLHRNATEHSDQVVRVEATQFEAFPPDRLRNALAEHPDCGLVVVVHVETSSGVVNDIESLGKIAKESGALFFVDAACSVGCLPYRTDDWGIDIGVTGSHKTLGSLPGLTLITLSDAALQILRRPSKMSPDLTSLLWLYENCLTRGRAPSYTHSTPLFQALLAATRERLTPSLAYWHAASKLAATEFRQLLRHAGIQFVTDGHLAHSHESTSLSSTVMAVKLPPGVHDEEVRSRMERVHGIFVIGNVGEMAGKSIRVGLMSPVQMDRKAYGATASALIETINYCLQVPKENP